MEPQKDEGGKNLWNISIRRTDLFGHLTRCSLLQCSCLMSARFLPADDDPVRPAVKVAEAEGAKYVGIVILLLCFLPLGVLVSMDLLKLIGWMKHGRRAPRRRQAVSLL